MQATPPPSSHARLPEIVQFVNVGDEEPAQKTPPPFISTQFPVIVQATILGEELNSQYTPPPYNPTMVSQNVPCPPVSVNPSRIDSSLSPFMNTTTLCQY